MPELKIFWNKVLVDDFSHARYSLGKYGERTVVEHRKYLTKFSRSLEVFLKH